MTRPDMSRAKWRKSSYSGQNGNCVEVAAVNPVATVRGEWRKSSHSGGNGNCAEVAVMQGVVAVRDSKNPKTQPLLFGTDEWAEFIAAVKRGRLDLK
ncbi:DUF397 domain-containing protein [Actinomadura miaoliensis]|uniref:DUF397 domain-containing protein n=1 Tax=Actinomadura miaoliensis TaxID=430685 RepID=A0ABP7WZW7_9ACTN